MNSPSIARRNRRKIAAGVTAGSLALSLGLIVASAAQAAITPAPAPGPEAYNIAPTGTATASSYYSEIDPTNATAGNYLPQNVIDGVVDTSKRWVSRFAHTAQNGYPADTYSTNDLHASWIQVTLPTVATVSEIVIEWDANCSNEYQVQVSPDGVNWTTTDSFGRVHGNCNVWWTLTKSHPVSTATPVKAVRVVSTLARATNAGMTINEIYIYGVNQWDYSPATPTSWSVADPKNLSLEPGVVASAKSQAPNSSASAGANTPAYGTRTENWAPAHAIDGLVASRWNSNYTGLPTLALNSYDPTDDWFQVKLPAPQPVYQTHIEWAAAISYHVVPSSNTATTSAYTWVMKPTRYSIQVSTDSDCSSWTTVARVANPFNADDQIIGVSDPVWCVRAQASKGFVPTRLGYAIAEFEVWDGPRPDAVVGSILPVPVEQTATSGGPFTLSADSRVVVSDAALAELGQTVAGQLRPATGYPLPVVTGVALPSDVSLVQGAVAELPIGNDVAAEEGYKLVVSDAGAVLTAPTEHGLFNAFQSLRQLFPAPIYSDAARVETWAADPITVVDYPRYGHRGLQIDPARNFITVQEVKDIIDEVAAVKTNILHMHLSDSQSWRLEIKGTADDPDKYKALELHATGQMTGYTGCNGNGCVNGFYTQEDFKEIVAYANAQYIEILPEVESPGHATAPVVALNREVACAASGNNNFCAVPGDPATEKGLAFWSDVFEQLAAISPGPIIHIGGDEVNGMAASNYEYWIGEMERMINENGKTIDSWNPGVDGYQNPTSINHYWSDYSPGAGTQHVSADWFDDGRPTIITPENSAYLDFSYAGSPGRTPTTESLKAWNWDPEWFIEKYRNYNVSQIAWGGPKPEDIIGIEAPLWGENMRGGLDNEYMIFPRFAGIAEKGWSPKASTQDYAAYQARLDEQGARWSYQGVNFGTIPETKWGVDGSGAVVGLAADLKADGLALAGLAAPGVDYTTVTATIDWGDGSALSPATVSGSDYLPASRRGRSLITAAADHTYSQPGAYNGTVTFLVAGESVAVPFVAEREFKVDAAVTPKCMGGKVYLNTSVKTDDDVNLDVATATPYGSKAAVSVTPGRAASGSFNSRLVSIPAGEATFGVKTSGDAFEATITVPYEAFSCG
ncbi:MAG: family 20 glycosylhydrolase [Bifidobacteriaceae bacterium]|nr:family 20 glycosylhydrolase [Bifidobacteriaceae bacterium]